MFAVPSVVVADSRATTGAVGVGAAWAATGTRPGAHSASERAGPSGTPARAANAGRTGPGIASPADAAAPAAEGGATAAATASASVRRSGCVGVSR